MKIIQKRPWLLVIFAFLLLISAWSSLIVIASKHGPESIEVPHSASHPEPTEEAP